MTSMPLHSTHANSPKARIPQTSIGSLLVSDAWALSAVLDAWAPSAALDAWARSAVLAASATQLRRTRSATGTLDHPREAGQRDAAGAFRVQLPPQAALLQRVSLKGTVIGHATYLHNRLVPCDMTTGISHVAINTKGPAC